jgi:chromosomal replication initiation ATPase DnaA
MVALINRRKPVRKGPAAMQSSAGHRATIEAIARAVAVYSRVSLEEMRSRSRRRAVSKAKAIAAVLGTRNGATVAEAARFFDRSRSTLIEQVGHYRATQPDMFADAEAALAPVLDVSPR